MRYTILLFSFFLAFIEAYNEQPELYENFLENYTFPYDVPNYKNLFRTIGNYLYFVSYNTDIKSYTLSTVSIYEEVFYNKVNSFIP